jgi:hypothetical protein
MAGVNGPAPASSLPAATSDVPGHATGRGIVIGLAVWFAGGFGLWVMLVVVAFELAYFGRLTRRPHLRAYCGRLLAVALVTWLVLSVLMAGVFLAHTVPVTDVP